LGPDQEICEDIPVTLDASQNNASYLWNTGETSPTIAVQTSGNYSVTVAEPNSPCIAIDNVFIDFPPIPQITLPNDSIICENTTFNITPISLSGNITWSVGSTDTTLSVNSPGTYFAEASNTCGMDIDSISLTSSPQPIVLLPSDIDACIGESVSLAPLEFLGDLLWSTGSVTEEIVVTSTSTISLSANNECGTVSDSVSVTFSDPPFILLERPYSFCEGQSLAIQALDWNGTLQWENDIIADSFTIAQAGTYQVTAFNACGEAVEMLEVIAEDCQQFYIPNAFSPNDDGFNDAFYFQDDGNILEIQTLLIFDRWGGLVFQRDNFPANDPSLGWNGKKNGATLSIGVYTFFTRVRTRDGILREFKGDVHLLR
jgi:gliding motility-associated-like protein